MSFGNQNPYEASYGSFGMTAADAAETERVGFIRRTYLHLAGAVMLFVGIEALIFAAVPTPTLMRITQSMMSGWNWLLVMGGFMVASWIADSWARSDKGSGMQYLGLGLYVTAQAVLFVPLLFFASLYAPNAIPAAGLMTAICFGALTAVVLLTRSDLSFLGRYLWWSGILALGVIVCGIFFQFSLGVWFSALMVGLAGGYILFHTSNILHHYRTDQHVAAALALFASVALFFWYILQLLISMRE
ncbi:MAG: US12 family protein [Pirellulaceae bacterium]|nr:US12 family protein [Pirellulaceae bacterium]